MPLNNGIITAPVDIGRDIAGMWGSNNYDLGYLITNMNWNKWAKYKPVRWSNPAGPTANELHALRYGLDFSDITEWESDHDSTVLGWGYNKPRGLAYSEYFRALDFAPAWVTGNGYNHNAIAPIVNTSSLDGSASPDGGQFLFNLENILATGANVELPISLFPSVFPQQYYLGLCFSNDTNGTVWWTSVDVTLAQLLSGQQLSNPSYYIPYLNAPGWNDGDLVIACYCLAPTALIDEQTVDLTQARSTNMTGVIPIVPDGTHGRWDLNISAYTVSKIDALYDTYPKVDPPISPQVGPYDVIVTGINFEVQTGAGTYLYNESEVRVVFHGEINGTQLGNNLVKTLSRNNTLQSEVLTITGYYSETYQELIQDNYEIGFSVTCWLERAPSDTKRIFYGTYNVNSGVTTWHTS